MKKLFLLILFFIAVSAYVNAQCTGTVLSWQNPSFEGTPGTPHVTPPLWDICQPGVTPDTQPGCWGITLPPSNGSSYVGFCNDSSIPWYEGASQLLSSPMVPGTTYNFTFDLATTASTGGGITPGCVEMQIWGNMGGNSGCDMTTLLWSSGDIFNAPHMDQWVTHSVSITPTSAWTHLLFMSHNLGCAQNVYIMMDNLSPISPVADVPQFTWTNVCLGNPMPFTSTSTSVGTITSYDWDWGDATAHGSGATPTHTYAAAGTYNVVMTMISTVPCTTTVTHQVTVYPNPTVTITPAAPTICSGSSTSLTAAGASTYSWNPGGLSGTTVTVSPAATTTYTVTGTDANGCTNIATATVTVNPNPTPSVTVTNASCGLSNGTATANPGGLAYAWSNTGNTQTITGLPAGTYTVTVTNGGCTGVASGTVVNVPGGVVTLDSTDEHCGHADGTATATMVGGTAPITYAWSNSGNTQTITGLPAGNYSVTVTDANSCTASNTIIVNNVAGPSVPFSNIINESCSQCNGAVTASPVNGLPPYSYLWSNSAATQTISNLCAGIYSITVTDANNCTAVNSVTITNAPPPTLNTSTTSANCGQNDGSATVVANGGTAPYTYTWSTVPVQNTATAANIPGGTYTVTVLDASNCSVTATAIVSLIGGPTANITTIDEVCGQQNGSMTVTASGGSGTYTYQWSCGGNTATINNLSAGCFTVTVNDGVCATTANACITNHPGPTASFSVNPSILTMDNNVTTITDNSVNAVQWAWDFGDGSTATGLVNSHSYDNSGTFVITLTITDINGCTSTTSQTVIVQPIFTLYIPNSFTPNGDGHNDFFAPTGLNIDMNKFEMYIYNRWGEEVYRTKDISKPWNGSKNNSGDKIVMDVYVYRILISELTGIKHEYFGRVSLLP